MKPLARPLGVVFDCADTEAMARFWQGIVGGTIDLRTASPTWLSLDSVDGFVKLSFQKVPEGKAVKNRVHLDLDVDDLDAAVKTTVGLGARVVGDVVEEPTNWFQVLHDIEGNEFCFILRKNR
jgi:predicted enzyme related to lactoylglutathione lyase